MDEYKVDSLMIVTVSPSSKTLLLAKRLRRECRRLVVQESGTAAIEFAIIAVPFFLLLVSIFEVGMVMFTQSALQGATQEAARQIRTGNVQANGDPETAFEDLLCAELVAAIDCNGQLVVDARAFDSVGEVSVPPFYGSSGAASGDQFDGGDPGQTVVVRVAYTWPIMTPLLTPFLANNGDGGRIITAATVFRNEPFNGALP